MVSCKVQLEYVFGGHSVTFEKIFKFPCAPSIGYSIFEKTNDGEEHIIEFTNNDHQSVRFWFVPNNDLSTDLLEAHVRLKLPTIPDLPQYAREFTEIVGLFGWTVESGDYLTFLNKVSQITKVPYQ